ncbi:MAG: hypothetical protein ACP5I8_04410 [Phycisphaerae bacterium]
MDKWVLQVLDGVHWEHAMVMIERNVGKLDLKVVALGSAVVPLFAKGKLRAALEKSIAQGLKLEICSVSMAQAGLTDAIPPVGAELKPGLIAISEARKAGYMYFVVA